MRKIICFILIFISFFTSVFAFWDAENEEVVTVEDVLEVANSVQEKPIIQASAGILFDRISKRILFDKNMNKKLPNASTTKMLTAIVACEHGNMSDIVTISKEAANTSGSTVKFREGDKISLNDLMLGLLMRSGNDCAVAIAEHIGGSIENFCKMMNEKAKVIGAMNTHFTSPHGLDDNEHYSTAYDLAIIADYALNIEIISNIVSRKASVIKVNDNSREIFNTNEMLSYYSGADGVKTGYTGDAGRCLVTSATRDNWQLISVVLGCNTKKQRTLESAKLLNYGFQNFSMVDLCENMQKKHDINVKKAQNDIYKITVESKYIYPILEEEKSIINYDYYFDQDLVAPLKKGSKIGEIKVKIGNDIVFTIEIRLNDDIPRKTMQQYILEILSLFPQNF